MFPRCTEVLHRLMPYSFGDPIGTPRVCSSVVHGVVQRVGLHGLTSSGGQGRVYGSVRQICTD